MNFGEPSPRSVDAANGFMVERVKKTPPGGIGLTKRKNFFVFIQGLMSENQVRIAEKMTSDEVRLAA